MSKSTLVMTLLTLPAMLMPTWASPALALAKEAAAAVPAGDDHPAGHRWHVEFGDCEDPCAGRSRGFLGIHLGDLTPELRRHFGAPEDTGVLISRVEPESPAAEAGLLVGDVLTAVDGESVDSSWALRREIAPRRAGDRVLLEIYREGRRSELQATLDEREGWSDGRHGHLLHFDSEEWEEIGERVRDALAGVDWEGIGRSIEDAVEEALETVEDSEVFEEMEQRLEEQIEQLEEQLEELDRRLGPQT